MSNKLTNIKTSEKLTENQNWNPNWYFSYYKCEFDSLKSKSVYSKVIIDIFLFVDNSNHWMVSIIESQQIQMCHTTAKGIGQMDFFGCIFCVQILTYTSVVFRRKSGKMSGETVLFLAFFKSRGRQCMVLILLQIIMVFNEGFPL